ncbi:MULTISPECIES: sigma-54 interaction domain-containing protein [Bacillus]|uniref:sigma-54 interaction domain-containing protein n=1 Tax=Bacillus TaxID=1386 RepID=UPI000BB6A6B4|nr:MULTISPECIES: sigma 54-interacting transcriptional regulator [Bacillus]
MRKIEALSNEMLKSILNGIDEAIHAVDKEGITIFYNENAAQHDDMRVEDVIGRHVLEVFPSLTKQTSTLLQVLSTQKAIYHQNQRFENKRGVIIETVNTTIPIFIDGVLEGAAEIAKNYSQLKMMSNKLVDLQSKLSSKGQRRNKSFKQFYSLQDFMTKDTECKRLLEQAEKISKTNLPVMIYGETGTGKEIIAQGIHVASQRNRNEFIAQNCAAIPNTLLESILFGTEKGSFTGAETKPGLLELADGGTLFLDELNSMPFELQAKLLRVMEDGCLRRVGSTKPIYVDIRIIVASNENPERCVREGKIRKDLYYRLSTCSLHIPALRKRPTDIPLLIHYFLEKNKWEETPHIPESTLDIFCQYEWHGNVRELKNTIELLLATNLGNKTIAIESLPSKFLSAQNNKKRVTDFSLRETLENKEMELIDLALQQTDGNIVQAARLLKIPRQTLQYKISKFSLTVPKT